MNLLVAQCVGLFVYLLFVYSFNLNDTALGVSHHKHQIYIRKHVKVWEFYFGLSRSTIFQSFPTVWLAIQLNFINAADELGLNSSVESSSFSSPARTIRYYFFGGCALTYTSSISSDQYRSEVSSSTILLLSNGFNIDFLSTYLVLAYEHMETR